MAEAYTYKQDRQCTHKRNFDTRSCNHYSREKAISITYSECVSVAFFMQHAKGMCHIISSSEACLSGPYFSTSSHTRHDSREEGIEHDMCAFEFLYNSCLKRFSF